MLIFSQSSFLFQWVILIIFFILFSYKLLIDWFRHVGLNIILTRPVSGLPIGTVEMLSAYAMKDLFF